MFKRKECKKRARKNLFKHYLLFIMLCFIASFLGTDYTSSYTELADKISSITTNGEYQRSEFNKNFQLNNAMLDIISQNNGNTKNITSDLANQASNQSSVLIGKHIELGHTEGVLAGLVNQISSGAFLITITSALYTVIGSVTAAALILTLISFILFFIVWLFLIKTFKIVYARMFLEGRIYKNVSFQRATFLISAKKWGNAAKVLFIQILYHTLWSFTIIGGIIKYFSYFAVPYIIAENPTLTSKEAITLSRKMMQGHKWECFLLQFSFLGWDILNIITFGLSGIFYSNPYMEATYCEYYAYLRKCAKDNDIENSDKLKDIYLFELAPDNELISAYGSLDDYPVTEFNNNTGILRKICSFFGIYFKQEANKDYRKSLEEHTKYKTVKNILDHKIYPSRLSSTPQKERRKLTEYLFVERQYSIWSVIIMFSLFSFLGWVWEVSLHYVQYGNFVNRGVLHGPWLPIYGTGCVLVLLLLNKLRNNPLLEFIAAIIVCGSIEYFIGWELEMTHGGQKWWSYEGYFLNIDGRVCAEGLLVFGIGGMIVVYFIAPILDNLIQMIPIKIVATFCICFIVLFAADKIYSSIIPNSGEGITSYNNTMIINDENLTCRLDNIKTCYF